MRSVTLSDHERVAWSLRDLAYGHVESNAVETKERMNTPEALASVAEELAALSVLEAAELSVVDDALLSVLELEAESVEEEESADDVLEPLSAEDVDVGESDEDVEDPDELFPLVTVTVHDLVSRTRGSPLSPVMGSRVIVHV